MTKYSANNQSETKSELTFPLSGNTKHLYGVSLATFDK